ncbi:MAG TPA: hypothetical protein VH482_19365 [Thermomicrobiales bacterium]|jgi:hypothetical protein
MVTALGVIVVALLVLVVLVVAVVLAIAVPIGLAARFVRRRAIDLPLARPPFRVRCASVPRAAAPDEAEALRAALRREAAAGRPEALARRLRRFAPDWPAVTALADVAAELGALQRNLAVARASGIPQAVTERLDREVRAATLALAARADRLAATAAFGVDSPLLREGLAREERELRRMVPAIREARAGLAELTLAGADGAEACRRAEGQFRTLAEVTRDLLDLARTDWEREFAPA